MGEWIRFKGKNSGYKCSRRTYLLVLVAEVIYGAAWFHLDLKYTKTLQEWCSKLYLVIQQSIRMKQFDWFLSVRD